MAYSPSSIPSFVQTNQVVKILATGAIATYDIFEADSGKTFLIPALGAAHALTINLPKVQAGLRFRFMATAILASAATLTPTNGANPRVPVLGLIQGSLFNIADATADAAGALGNAQVVNDVTLKANGNTAALSATARAGDFIDINSDGEFWYVSGMSSVAAGLA